MEIPATANKMHQYAEWSLQANRAQYALEYFLRGLGLDDRARSYLEEGLELCRTLQQGLEAQGKQITVAQLGSLSAFEPVQEQTGERQEDIAAQLGSATQTIESILKGQSEAHAAAEEIEKTSTLLDLIIDTYADRVHSDLEELRRREFTHV